MQRALEIGAYLPWVRTHVIQAQYYRVSTPWISSFGIIGLCQGGSLCSDIGRIILRLDCCQPVWLTRGTVLQTWCPMRHRCDCTWRNSYFMIAILCWGARNPRYKAQKHTVCHLQVARQAICTDCGCLIRFRYSFTHQNFAKSWLCRTLMMRTSTLRGMSSFLQ